MNIGPLDFDTLLRGTPDERRHIVEHARTRRRNLRRYMAALDMAIEEYDAADPDDPQAAYDFLSEGNIAENDYHDREHRSIVTRIEALSGKSIDQITDTVVSALVDHGLIGFACEDGVIFCMRADGSRTPLDEMDESIYGALREVMEMPGVLDDASRKVLRKVLGTNDPAPSGSETIEGMTFDDLPVAEPERTIRDFDGRTE